MPCLTKLLSSTTQKGTHMIPLKPCRASITTHQAIIPPSGLYIGTVIYIYPKANSFHVPFTALKTVPQLAKEKKHFVLLTLQGPTTKKQDKKIEANMLLGGTKGAKVG